LDKFREFTDVPVVSINLDSQFAVFDHFSIVFTFYSDDSKQIYDYIVGFVEGQVSEFVRSVE